MAAVGDIASCDNENDAATADLVAGIDGPVLLMGDVVYPAGSDENYASCYAPHWGPFKDRTHPAPGNHDVQDDQGAAYFRYFGSAAGTAGEGWYSFDAGDWHLIALNSNCGQVGCGNGSAQLEWLRADLALTDAPCALAYWHHPRFSSGPHGNDDAVAPMWRVLDRAGVDLLLAGHDHLYERLAPQTSDGVADPDGPRQITVGTGGRSLYAVESTAPNSELVINDRYGVLVLTLRADGYDWAFRDTAGDDLDTGSAPCR